MKKFIVILIIFLILGGGALAEDSGPRILDEQINILDFGDLESMVNDSLADYNLPNKISIKSLVFDLIRGRSNLKLKDLLNGLILYFFQELKSSFSLLGKILLVAIISSLLTNLQATFENESISNIANYVAYSTVAILTLASFNEIIRLVEGTIEKMSSFMEAILPILLTLLTLSSGINTKLLFNPIMVTLVNLIALLIKNAIIPLIYISFIIVLISNVSKRLEFGKLAEMIRQLITIMISGFFTIFIGIITIYGMGTKIDGLSIRTAKFAIDKFIPIVGGFLSDAVETVVAYSSILKNALGFIGLISLLLICLLPIIKVFTLFFVYKLTSVLVQPIVDKNMTNLFDEVSKSLLLILISLISTAIMFFITITVMVETANKLLMLS